MYNLESLLENFEEHVRKINEQCDIKNKELKIVQDRLSNCNFGISVYMDECLNDTNLYLGFDKLDGKWSLCVKADSVQSLMLQKRSIRMKAHETIERLILKMIATCE